MRLLEAKGIKAQFSALSEHANAQYALQVEHEVQRNLAPKAQDCSNNAQVRLDKRARPIEAIKKDRLREEFRAKGASYELGE